GITGINALASVINTQMKLPIDNYVMITMEGFKEAVDAMGGVEVTIDETITFSEEDIMEPGTYLLNGDRAELFVRWRGYSDADIGRMNVQRYFISGLIKKLDSLTTVEMISLVRSLYKYVESDLTVDEMITLASNVKSMSTSDMTLLRVPGEGVNGYGSMQLSVYSVHAEELADLLNTYMRPYSDPVPASELEVVEIQNTSSTWDDPNVATLDEYEGSGG
ncbi:MAG: LCP family protein, partial [Oscillospiraceae bacterium]